MCVCGGGGGGGGGRAPEHYARALCCNTAGPFQICFLRACPILQYGRREKAWPGRLRCDDVG